jgi:hypothetical protein
MEHHSVTAYIFCYYCCCCSCYSPVTTTNCPSSPSSSSYTHTHTPHHSTPHRTSSPTEPDATKNKRKAQFRVYDQCLQHHLHKHTWMGFIDLDEFLVLSPLPAQRGMPATAPVTVTVPDVLRPYEQYGGLGINIKIFGSSGMRCEVILCVCMLCCNVTILLCIVCP